ncbi:MAG TPA: carboxypeptidase-like regulatory domain-containing protein [Candidatus Acidoferrales bacterium]|nr:carboxypeptidase-like regulatory domain-containing protein [Candidatus Acidoferrales bacterium]
MAGNQFPGWRRAIKSGSVVLFFAFCGAMLAVAGTVTGTVRNGTTNKPVAGAEVILLQLQGGMDPVATAKTDSSGHFSITNDALGGSPMLLRVPYKGVLYHQPISPGATTADVEIYEPTSDPHSFTVTSRAIILQPKGSDLLVGEEYDIQNQSNPPVAYFLKDGTFKFQVPSGGQLNQVSAWGATGMPVIQGTIDLGKGLEAVDWPFRPGDNGIRITYQLPYASNQATLQNSSRYNVQRVLLVAPPGLQVSSEGFAPAGTEQGYNVYTRDSVAANTPISIAVSGTAPEPAAASPGDTQDPSVNSRADSSDAAASVTTLPPRLDDNLKYILIAGFSGLFILGVLFLWRKPAAVPVASGAAIGAPPAAPGKRFPRRAAEEKASAASVAQVQREVTHSLDELKENLFRLELRHQAGTISEEDYARERQRTEAILRDLVKG